nr:hypothetical protein [Mycoplasmopsis bovis]
MQTKCNPDSDNIVEFRLGIKDLNLRFANYGAFSSKELDEMLKQKPLKDGEFTVVYPSQEELEKEAKIIRDFFEKEETKKIPKLSNNLQRNLWNYCFGQKACNA